MNNFNSRGQTKKILRILLLLISTPEGTQPHLPRTHQQHLVTFNHANWPLSICMHHAKLARRHKQRPQQHARGSYSHACRPSRYEPPAMHAEHPPPPATRRTALLQHHPIFLCSHGATGTPLMARS